MRSAGVVITLREHEALDLRRRRMLSEFLRTRRTRLSPVDVGMPAGARRRTPGLRRDEVAERARINLEWYTRLEQGRDIQISAAVLNGLVRALCLTADEQLHLAVLTTPASTLPLPAAPDSALDLYQRLVTSLPDTPA